MKKYIFKRIMTKKTLSNHEMIFMDISEILFFIFMNNLFQF